MFLDSEYEMFPDSGYSHPRAQEDDTEIEEYLSIYHVMK